MEQAWLVSTARRLERQWLGYRRRGARYFPWRMVFGLLLLISLAMAFAGHMMSSGGARSTQSDSSSEGSKGSSAAGSFSDAVSGLQMRKLGRQVAENETWVPPPKPRPVVPLPWRPQYHLDNHSPGDYSVTAPAYVISAFLDTRPVQHNMRPRIAVLTAVAPNWTVSSWKCVLSHTHNGLQELHTSDVSSSTAADGEAEVPYNSTTLFCELPTALDNVLASGSTQNEDKLSVTVAAAGETISSAKQLLPEVWVDVLPIPQLTVEEREQHALGKGVVSVCAPILHSDIHAATLVEWAEFQRILGAHQVTAYSLNPGPALQPLVEFYRKEGFFQIFEWIVPSSVVKNHTAECALPFHHASKNRAKYHSANCTYQRDNYLIAEWGRALALQDCMYRTMTERHRWVAVVDFDEYLVPRQVAHGQTWQGLLRQLAKDCVFKTEYQFQGFTVCSGCSHAHHQQQVKEDPHPHKPGEKVLTFKTIDAANPSTHGLCLRPAVGFHHILWSTVVANDKEELRSITDPFSVEQAGMGKSQFSRYSLVPAGVFDMPDTYAVKLHAHAHETTDGNETFTARMLALVQVHAQGVARGMDEQLPMYPALGHCEACSTPTNELSVDYSVCNSYGYPLYQRLSTVIPAMRDAGVFGLWLTASRATTDSE